MQSYHRTLQIIAVVLLVLLASPRPPAIADTPSSSAITLVSGTISTVSATAITIRMPDSDKTMSYPIAASPIVLIDGVPRALTDLKPGYIANVVSSGGVADEIDARTPNSDIWGKIVSVSLTSITVATATSDTDTYALDPTTRISVFSKILTAADLKTGMYAHITYAFGAPGTASAVDVVRPDNGITHGKISAVDATSITLQSRKGDTTTFTITPKTTITISDKTAKITDLKAGQYAHVTTPDGTIATAVAVIDAPAFPNRRGSSPDSDGGDGP